MSYVYFVQAGEGGDIKVGRAQNLSSRFRMIQTGCSKQLIVLGIEPGGDAREKAYHKKYASYRQHGEWFSPSPIILADAANLAPWVPPKGPKVRGKKNGDYDQRCEKGMMKAIKMAGGQAALARACGITQAAVWKWTRVQKRVPAEYVALVEAASGVPRSELRPDLHGEGAAA